MKHISIEQRYQIEAYLNLKQSKDFIAKQLGVDRSSIYREVKRNRLANGKYSARKADEYYNDRKDRFTVNRKFTLNCQRTVLKHLNEQWSPKQIVGYCAKNNIDMVSHERIYQYIRKDKNNGGKLYMNLRHKLKYRRRPIGKHYPIANRVSIDERPDVVEKKQRFGDWEMDTIIGANQQDAILTLTERATNFIFIEKLKLGKDAAGLKKQIINLLLPYKDYVHTITTDNGPEFAQHLQIAEKIKSAIYFAHPYCSWEKGSIENANKLIRQYINKKENFNEYSKNQLADIQYKINNRPRDKLNFDCPKNLFYNLVNGNVAFGC